MQFDSEGQGSVTQNTAESRNGKWETKKERNSETAI